MAHFEKLLESFDQSVIEHKQGMSYIGHEHIRLRVIDATDNHFDWEVTGVDYRTDGVVRDRQNKQTGEMFTPQVMVVTGKLTIPGLGTRTGMGVQVLEGGAGEDAYKGAESDAFKRAAMAFGVALKQLYVDSGKPVAQPQREPTPIQTARPENGGAARQTNMKRMFALCADLGIDEAEFKKYLQGKYHIESRSELSDAQLVEVVGKLREREKKQQAEQGEFDGMNATIDRAAKYLN